MRTTPLLTVVALTWLIVASPVPGVAQTTTATCQKEIVKRLATFKKAYLKNVTKCLNLENEGKLTGPCPDALNADVVTTFKINKAKLAAEAGIPSKCALTDLTALGFRNDCQYEAATSGIEGTCAGLSVTDTASFTDCLLCWKRAELAELVAILYASHANEVCQSDLTETSPACSDLDCATPLPDQGQLTGTSSGGEEFCQKGIGKAGVKYALYREKTLETCALKGGTQSGCLSGSFDPNVPLKLSNASDKRLAAIQKACTPRTPSPSEPFCCQTQQQGNVCAAAATRDDCTMLLAGTVVEGKTCGGNSKCTPGKTITWWGVCPESDCSGTIASLDDLNGCVGTSADQVVDELICLQFHGNGGADWPCPAADGP